MPVSHVNTYKTCHSQIFTLYLLHEHQHHVVAAVGQCLYGCIQQPDAMVLTTEKQ